MIKKIKKKKKKKKGYLIYFLCIHPPCNTFKFLGEVIVVAYYKTIKVKILEALEIIGDKILNIYLLVSKWIPNKVMR